MDKQPSSRSCFLCGRENEIGLKMTWFNDTDAEQVRAVVAVPKHFCGYPGVVHGGIVSALLDETSGRAIMMGGGTDNLFVTARLEVTYRHPTPTEQPLTIIGWVDRQGKNRARVRGEIRLADGTVTAECQATVLRPPKSFLEDSNWADEAKYWRVYED
ncbi:MAG: PaaI family thioesterase [Acidobacteriota bacterium]